MKAPLQLPATVLGFEKVAAVPNLHLAIGIFDGVHLGHQAVIHSAVSAAKVAGGVSGAMTFYPHPTRLLAPGNPTLLLQPPRMKSQLLHAQGVQLTIWKKFTAEFAAITAEDFVGVLKSAMPGLRGIHIGENFRFGRGRLGDVSMLIKTARPLGIDVLSVERLRYNGVPISSSRIRQLIKAGDISSANELLGYRYFSEGVVVPGQQLARKLGFPTLNLMWQPEFRPHYGVYAVQVTELGKSGVGGVFPAVANYGVRPTVAPDSSPVLEVHLLAPTAWSEGTRLRVEWLKSLRPETKFASLEALKAQIAADTSQARAFFKLD